MKIKKTNNELSITDKEIDSFTDAIQYYSDCYLMTTLETLSYTNNGRKILKEQICRDEENSNIINCYLYSPKGEKTVFSISQDYIKKYYGKLYEKQPNKIVRAVDVAVAEYEKKYKSKFWLCRLTDKFRTFRFENDIPSHFMTNLTGIKPRTIAEKHFNIDLSGYKNEVMKLFKRMEKEKQYSFLITTGWKVLDGRSWHVYILQAVNLKNHTITVKEKHKNEPKIMDIDQALKTFKFITGYFNGDLEKK